MPVAFHLGTLYCSLPLYNGAIISLYILGLHIKIYSTNLSSYFLVEMQDIGYFEVRKLLEYCDEKYVLQS